RSGSAARSRGGGSPRSLGPEKPDLAEGQAPSRFEPRDGGPVRSLRARHFGRAGEEADAGLARGRLGELDHDVAPADAAAPARAQGLARRLLGRDRERDRARARRGATGQAGRLPRIHQLVHEAIAPAREGAGDPVDLHEVHAEADDQALASRRTRRPPKAPRVPTITRRPRPAAAGRTGAGAPPGTSETSLDALRAPD